MVIRAVVKMYEQISHTHNYTDDLFFLEPMISFWVCNNDKLLTHTVLYTYVISIFCVWYNNNTILVPLKNFDVLDLKSRQTVISLDSFILYRACRAMYVCFIHSFNILVTLSMNNTYICCESKVRFL